MTTTEQADKIISKMRLFAPYPECIKCATLAVDLLIDCTHSEDIVEQQIGLHGYNVNQKYTYEYWKDVKAELKQKLYNIL